MKKICVLLCLVLILPLCLVFVPSNNRVSALTSSAKGMCVLDAKSGRILYSKNENEKLPMASTTKVATAITVLSNCNNLDEMIEVDDASIGIEGTSIYLRKGEIIKVKDLLYGLMLRSGNDAATALAIHIGGSVEGFTELMNNLANSVGAKNSHFANPHGLDNKEHYTTAYDLALITRYALNNPTFKEIVSTKHHTIPATNMSDIRYLTNKNKLLNSLEGCCGVKTGYTSKAGRCLVSACERDDNTSICVVLNCGPMFEESTQLLNASFEEYKHIKLVDKNKEIYNEYVQDDKNARLYLYAEEDYSYPFKDNEISNIKLKYTVNTNGAEENSYVGDVEIYLYNCLLKKVKLFTINKIDKLVNTQGETIENILWEENINENQ